MRCYEVKASGRLRFAGTAASAKATRDKLIDDFDCKKSEITIEQTEIPTGKRELLDFVNSLCVLSDTDEDEGKY